MPIFSSDSDYIEYINRLELLSFEERCYVHAHSIMPNHGHIILQQTTENPIAHLMQRLQGGFTQYWNTKYQKVGHIFQGRYKCLLCQEESYLLELVRYIHLNAPRAGLVRTPEEYPWCSHRDYLNSNNDTFIHTKLIRSYFASAQEFDLFVKSGLNKNKQFHEINLSIETAISKGLSHPLPSLSDLASQICAQEGHKLTNKDKTSFIKQARQYGYPSQDIAAHLGICRKSLYRLLSLDTNDTNGV